MPFKREIDLEMATIPFIKKCFRHWSWQIPSYNRVIDFGGINFKNELIGIEYKLHDWRRALKQADSHRMTFDYLYILLPERKYANDLIEEAKKNGIGIIIFNGNPDIILKPRKQRYRWRPSQRNVRKMIHRFKLHNRTI